MKITLFLILLLTLNSYSQDFVGKWKPISYEDEVSYYNRETDSLSYKIPARKDEAESFRKISDFLIFTVIYNFDSNGKYILEFHALGETINGDYKVDKLNKKIVMIDDESKKEELSYGYVDGILFLEMKMETGLIKLGLTKVND